MPKHILVTGASKGLGYAVATDLSSQGYVVTGWARNSMVEPSRLNFDLSSIDVSDHKDVSEGFERAVAKNGLLTSVINCAGVLGPIGSAMNNQAQAWTDAININLIGTFNVFSLGAKHLEMDGASLIALSGGGATKSMPNFSAYAASKSGVVRFVETLADELENSETNVFAVAPGAMPTDMINEVLDSPIENVGREYYREMQKVSEENEQVLTNAVEFISYLVNKNPNDLSGRLISAVWDDWKKWNAMNEAPMMSKDMFKLRRVVS